MESYSRIIREEYITDNMAEKLDNNNSPWNSNKSISYEDLNELGCEILHRTDVPERKKRVRSSLKPEDIAYNDMTAAEAKDFSETQKAKYIRAENFLYRQIAKPIVVSKDGFSCLSDEIILSVFKYLSHEDLKYVAQVNQRFRRLSNDECLWPRIDLSGKMLNINSLAYILKKGVKVLRLKEATIKSPIWDKLLDGTLQDFYSKIEFLDMSYCIASSQDIALLLSKCRNLRKLSLESCEISTDVCKQIGENRLLDTLNLAMTEGLDSDGLKIICSSCQRLQHLNIAWTHLNGENVKIIVADVSKTLLTLNLSGLGLSVVNNSIKTLVHRCNRLVELDISDCVDVTSSIIPDITESLPNIKSLAISRCYKIDPKILIFNLVNMPNLISLTAFRVIGSSEAKVLENKFSMLRVNKDYYSTIARPTVGVRRTSIWLARCRE